MLLELHVMELWRAQQISSAFPQALERKGSREYSTSPRHASVGILTRDTVT